ncbi:MAG: inositol monophosphatase [gamma proteobacterium symbiont of Taylorina sp.]|nr:inositol monophosphatase [gamma proteobacterium symbiont of Taylorina sp.]
MHLSHTQLHCLSRTAVSAAAQAGQLLTKYSKLKIPVQKKTGGDSLASQVVTEVDHLCQDTILKILMPTCEKYDIALLTEECDDDKMRLEKDFFWSIDPLDGTLPFIESSSGYAVSIALVNHSGTPLIGVIYDPVRQTLYHAIKTAGAFKNSKPWRLPAISEPEKHFLTLVSDRSFLQHKNYLQIMEKLNRAAAESGFAGLKTIQHGGAAMNACWVLENSPGCYFKFPKQNNGGGSLWDYAATTCIFNEIDAFVSDIHGNPLDLNRPDSTFMNHRGILYASNRHIAESITQIYNSFVY